MLLPSCSSHTPMSIKTVTSDCEQPTVRKYNYKPITICIYSCWLSTANGLIWSFVGPVIAVIIVSILITSYFYSL